jgi:hypothetical protein
MWGSPLYNRLGPWCGGGVAQRRTGAPGVAAHACTTRTRVRAARCSCATGMALGSKRASLRATVILRGRAQRMVYEHRTNMRHGHGIHRDRRGTHRSRS